MGDSMKWVAALILGGLLAGCALIDPEGAEQRAQAEIQKRKAAQAQIERIIVVPADISRPYRILGPVKAPQEAFGRCLPDDLRAAAVERYGRVDAIIGFIGSVREPLAITGNYCEGTAVVFTE